MRTLIKSQLRPLWRNTSRKVFIQSVRHKATNKKTGRQHFVVDCVDCGRTMGVNERERRVKRDGTLEKKPKSVYEVDHINGITPLSDISKTIGDYYRDLIYGTMEIVCVECHKKRTAKQTKKRNKERE